MGISMSIGYFHILSEEITNTIHFLITFCFGYNAKGMRSVNKKLHM